MRFPWQKHDDDLRRELEHHLAELTDELMRQGHSEQEARRLAAREFGSSEVIKDQCRDESPWAWLQSFRQDIRFGLRQLRQAPIVTAAAVLSLALGIGANSAILSLMNTVLWRTLPVPAPEELSLVHWQAPEFPEYLCDNAAGSDHPEAGLHLADFFPMAAVERMERAIAGKGVLAPYSFENAASIQFAGRPLIAPNRPVGGNFFATLRVQAALGRTLSEADDKTGAPAVAVISHSFHVRQLGADPKVIGKTIRINQEPYEIVGVLPESFYGLVPGDMAQIYTPLWKSSEFARPRMGRIAFNEPRAWVLQILVRREQGIRAEALQPILAAAFRQSWEPKGNAVPEGKEPQLRLDDGSRGLGDLSRNFRDPLYFLGALLGLVLLIACANIANLLLARATARSKEVALRLSLGCTQSRLLRQFLTESALLALFGGLASILVAYGSARGLSYFLSHQDNSGEIPLTIDVPMVGAIAIISILTLLLFGLFPAWRASRVDTNSALKEGAGSLGGASRHWWTPGRLLIVGQMSLSILLVLSAVIFTENLRSLSNQQTGFDRNNLLVFGLRPGTSGYTEATLPNFYDRMQGQLAATPGVEEASLATIRPMNSGGWWDDIREVGKPKSYSVAINRVTPSYLRIFTPQLVAGRQFTPADLAPNAPRVAILSEDLARAIDPVRSVVGRRIHSSSDPKAAVVPIEVIGVVQSIAFNSMKARPHVLWLPFESKTLEATVVLRTKANPSAMLPAVRKAVAGIDSKLPLVDVFTMEELVNRNLQRERMFAALCGSFGFLALLLSVIGLYGVMSYNASRRRSEIGVRLALGATRSDVTWLVLREALALTLLGLGLGAPAIYFGSQYLEKELYKMEPLNPFLIGFSVLLLAGSATLAAWLPARRAASLDPASALRQD